MATFDTYVDIAKASYGRRGEDDQTPVGWTMHKRDWASWYGDGFQGAIFTNGKEVVVGFAGTMGNLKTAPISQNTANARIGVNVIPNMAGSAQAMVNDAKQMFPGKSISLVGHSLGGGLAQVVGNWSGCPFISLNGPGMASHLKMSAFNLFKPRQMIRSVTSANTQDTIGICLSVKGDFTGNFGSPVGYAVVLNTRSGVYSATGNHGYEAVSEALNTKGWRLKSPRDVYSIWPRML
jgi:putative lipase involved disintegration of autophagic bodies